MSSTLRLRGTFLDFRTVQSEFEGGVGHGSRVRSFSSPPGIKSCEEPAESFEKCSHEYLHGLVSRVMKLSSSIQLSGKACKGNLDPRRSQLDNRRRSQKACPGHQDEIIPKQEAGYTSPLDKVIVQSKKSPASKVLAHTQWPEGAHAVQSKGPQPIRPSPFQKDAVGVSNQGSVMANVVHGDPQRCVPNQCTAVTTLMIRNIPCKMTLKGMVDLFQSYGFGGTYDFLHLPGRGHPFSNLGYAFINFSDSSTIDAFIAKFQGVAFAPLTGINTEKVIEIRPARAQGFAENIAKVHHLMSASDDSSLFVMTNGASYML
mmetsp:Transcript_109287/g.189647  ORF Transcript_109287/g.189647 Transcript_109287/m.189647 type:complete len:316 (-) Transcript_109287:76-1023(-)